MILRTPRITCPFFCGLLLLLWSTGSLDAATPKKNEQVKKSSQGIQRRGDISLRFSAGPQLYELSTASGEPLSTPIGERAFGLSLIPEYTYRFRENTAFFITSPIELDVDLVVGTTVGWGLGAGIRQYINAYFYADLQILISFIRRSLGRLEFGGFALGFGASIPIGERFCLLIIAQAPFNFIDGFVLRVRGYLGFETFF